MHKINNNGATLIEMLTVLVIFVVIAAVIYTTMFSNWLTFDDRMARADMWHEANEIFETITDISRNAKSISVAVAPDGEKTAIVTDTDDATVATYVVTVDGKFQIVHAGGAVQTLTENLDASNSDLVELTTKSLYVKLAFQKELFRRTIHFETATEVLVRN